MADMVILFRVLLIRSLVRMDVHAATPMRKRSFWAQVAADSHSEISNSFFHPVPGSTEIHMRTAVIGTKGNLELGADSTDKPSSSHVRTAVVNTKGDIEFDTDDMNKAVVNEPEADLAAGGAELLAVDAHDKISANEHERFSAAVEPGSDATRRVTGTSHLVRAHQAAPMRSQELQQGDSLMQEKSGMVSTEMFATQCRDSCHLNFIKLHQVGGTTVRSMLKQMVDASQHFARTCNSEAFGHWCGTDEIRQRGRVPPQWKAIIVLRDPVEKFLSAFYKHNFHSSVDDDRYFSPWPPTVPWLIDRTPEGMRNTTAVEAAIKATLGHHDIDHIQRRIREYSDVFGDASGARNILEQFAVVGITEDIPRLCMHLGQFLGLTSNACSATYPGKIRRNPDRLRNESPELRAWIQSRLQAEVDVYNIAKDISGRHVRTSPKTNSGGPLLFFATHHKSGTKLARVLAKTIQKVVANSTWGPFFARGVDWNSTGTPGAQDPCPTHRHPGPTLGIFQNMNKPTLQRLDFGCGYYRMIHFVRDPVALTVSGYLYHSHVANDTAEPGHLSQDAARSGLVTPRIGPSVYGNLSLLEGLKTEATMELNTTLRMMVDVTDATFERDNVLTVPLESFKLDFNKTARLIFDFLLKDEIQDYQRSVLLESIQSFAFDKLPDVNGHGFLQRNTSSGTWWIMEGDGIRGSSPCENGDCGPSHNRYSCDDICAAIEHRQPHRYRYYCDQATIDNLTTTTAIHAAFAAAGFNCEIDDTGCETRYGGGHCGNWGSPYLYNQRNYLFEGRCFFGDGSANHPHAACGQNHVDANHRRLCPCKMADCNRVRNRPHSPTAAIAACATTAASASTAASATSAPSKPPPPDDSITEVPDKTAGDRLHEQVSDPEEAVRAHWEWGAHPTEVLRSVEALRIPLHYNEDGEYVGKPDLHVEMPNFPHQRESNVMARRPIPHILHQSWKIARLPVMLYPYITKWRAVHPEWTFNFWTNRDNAKLWQSEEPDTYDMYTSFGSEIIRADASRLIYMRKFGGVYSDLDVEPCQNLDALLANAQLVFVRSPFNFISNFLIASSAGHPFWEFALRQLQQQEQRETIIVHNASETSSPHISSFGDSMLEVQQKDNRVAWVAGPRFLDKTLKKFMKVASPGVLRGIKLLDYAEFQAEVGIHHWAGTWHCPPGRLDCTNDERFAPKFTEGIEKGIDLSKRCNLVRNQQNLSSLHEGSSARSAIKELCFVHVGKCGGLSLVQALTALWVPSGGKLLQVHAMGQEGKLVQTMPGPLIGHSLAACTATQNVALWVRDPVSRFISLWNFFVDASKTNPARHPGKKSQRERLREFIVDYSLNTSELPELAHDNLGLLRVDLERLLIQLFSRDIDIQKQFFNMVPHASQSLAWYLQDCSSLPNMHIAFVGRHEYMDQDWSKFGQVLGVPRSPLPYTHSANYSSKSRTLSKSVVASLRQYYVNDYTCFKTLADKHLISHDYLDDIRADSKFYLY